MYLEPIKHFTGLITFNLKLPISLILYIINQVPYSKLEQLRAKGEWTWSLQNFFGGSHQKTVWSEVCPQNIFIKKKKM